MKHLLTILIIASTSLLLHGQRPFAFTCDTIDYGQPEIPSRATNYVPSYGVYNSTPSTIRYNSKVEPVHWLDGVNWYASPSRTTPASVDKDEPETLFFVRYGGQLVNYTPKEYETGINFQVEAMRVIGGSESTVGLVLGGGIGYQSYDVPEAEPIRNNTISLFPGFSVGQFASFTIPVRYHWQDGYVSWAVSLTLLPVERRIVNPAFFLEVGVLGSSPYASVGAALAFKVR